MTKFSGSLAQYPARATFIWFIGLIVAGTLLLEMPICAASAERPISFHDALFTATSAACVTGLTVRSTANDFSLFGQGVILSLMQLGGIGIITVTTYLTLQFGGRANLRHKVVLKQTLGSQESDLRWVLASVLRFVLTFELAGLALLFARNLVVGRMEPGYALWHALFHAISAFCNAGFALADDSLAGFRGDLLVNFTVMPLVIIGGIGFPVMFDLRRNWRGWRRETWDPLTLHTKLMLIGTAGLLSLATVMFLLLEWNRSLAEFPWWERLLVALFQAVTPRTAGFQTIDLAHLSEATLFMLIVLMLIGGGPCSCAGGFKVSTMMVLVCQSWAKFRGSTRINLFRRSIPVETVSGALATAFLFGVVAGGALTALLIVQPRSDSSFLYALFEVASALGTTGLSVYREPGAAPLPGEIATYSGQLTALGRWIIVVLMFLGRLGPISVFVALSRSERKACLEYPKEDVLVG